MIWSHDDSCTIFDDGPMTLLNGLRMKINKLKLKPPNQSEIAISQTKSPTNSSRRYLRGGA